MAQIVKELRVDVSQPNVFQAIVAKQHDSNSRFLKITLVDFGVKVEVPNTAKVTINANRPDGASESFKGEANNDGTITVPLAQWMLDIDGEVKCDVSVTNTEDNKRLTSTDFWLEVQKAANPNASIPLDPDGEILIIKPVTEINGNSKDTDYPSAKAVYDYGQNIVTDTQITATATGKAITIDSAKAPLQNLKLFGKTEQNGTPTPDAPVPLVSVGDSGSFEVGVYGKNLLASVQINHNGSGLTITDNNDGTYTLNGTPTGSEIRFISVWDAVKVGYRLPIGKYRFNAWVDDTEIKGVRQVTIANGTILIGTYNNSFEITSQGYGISTLKIAIDTDVTYTNAILKLAIFTEEFKNSPYEPYKAKQTLTITDTLRSVGDIKDEVGFNRGVKTQKMGEYTVTSSDTFANHNGYVCINLDNVLCYGTSGVGITDILAISNYFQGASWSKPTDESVFPYFSVSRIAFKTSMTMEEFKAFVTEKETEGKPLKILYRLATPIETPLTETELNAYRQLMTNKGTTTILSECEDTEITYYVNKPNAQAIGSLHEQINKDYFKLQQAIISTGGSTL